MHSFVGFFVGKCALLKYLKNMIRFTNIIKSQNRTQRAVLTDYVISTKKIVKKAESLDHGAFKSKEALASQITSPFKKSRLFD